MITVIAIGLLFVLQRTELKLRKLLDERHELLLNGGAEVYRVGQRRRAPIRAHVVGQQASDQIRHHHRLVALKKAVLDRAL